MNNIFQTWTKQSLSKEYLAIFRVLFSLFLFFFIGFPRFDWISSYPDIFYNPYPSFASLFEGFPNRSVFVVLNFLLPLGILFILVGFKTKIASIGVSIVLIISSSFVFAFGKIEHSHLINFTPLIFAFSGWGGKYSVDAMLQKQNNKNVNVIPFFGLVIAFSYFTSALSKILGGWLDFEYQAAYSYLILNYHFIGRTDLLSTFFLNIHSTVFWEIVDYIVILCELLPLCFLFNRKLFSFSLYNLAVFHVLVYLLFNISFAFYPLLFLVYLINWEKSSIVRCIILIIEKNKNRVTKLLILCVFIVLYVFYISMMNIDFGYGEYPLGYVISLFLSFIFVSVFYFEKLLINNGKRRCNKS